jgi:hypothetical protein
MANRVTLTFVVDVSEDEAWDIADSLEKAAIKRNFREVNGYVTADGRSGLLGSEGNPVSSSAEVRTRVDGNKAMGFGGTDAAHIITLGDEHGRSG